MVYKVDQFKKIVLIRKVIKNKKGRVSCSALK